MKNIKKNIFYRIFLVLSLSSALGISYATESTLSDGNQDKPVVTEETSAVSLSKITQKIAAFAASRLLGCAIADFCNSTLLHSLSYTAKDIACSFCDTAYNHYESGKSFTSDVKALVPESIKNTLTTYANNKVIAPFMIACTLGPVWAPYVGISTVCPAVMGIGLQILAKK